MTDRIVDSDLDTLEEVNHNDLEQQLKGEQTTTSEEPTPEEQSEETVVPPKFKGKSVDEILESYQNLEQQYGKQGNELGELRKLADTLIQKNLQESQNNTVQEQEQALTEDDFLGMLRILGPLAPSPKTCQQLLVEVDGKLEWNLGWILAFGNGNRGSSYSWFWTFANRKKAPWYARQGSYLNDFVIYGGWNPTYPYLCKRTGSSLPDTKGGWF